MLVSLRYVALLQTNCNRMPDLSSQTWITALQAMYLIGEFAEGKSILWHAGASAVSIAGQQLSVANGASAVFATARSDHKAEFCVKELGAKAAYNTETTDWAAEVLKATDGKGVDIIVDYIGYVDALGCPRRLLMIPY